MLLFFYNIYVYIYTFLGGMYVTGWVRKKVYLFCNWVLIEGVSKLAWILRPTLTYCTPLYKWTVYSLERMTGFTWQKMFFYNSRDICGHLSNVIVSYLALYTSNINLNWSASFHSVSTEMKENIHPSRIFDIYFLMDIADFTNAQIIFLCLLVRYIIGVFCVILLPVRQRYQDYPCLENHWYTHVKDIDFA